MSPSTRKPVSGGRGRIFAVTNHEVEIPVKVFVAAQVLQFHGLDLVVVQVKLMETVWEI